MESRSDRRGLCGPSMSKSCIVTGAAGFIGSHLVDRLLTLGYRVAGVDNLLLGKRVHLDCAMQNADFSFKEVDVNDYDACLSFLREAAAGGGHDVLWHLAANSDIQGGANDPAIDLKATFMTTYNALKMARALGVPHFAFASSSAIYGEHKEAVDEDTGPWFPVSNYGAMKLASEATITAGLEQFLKQAWIFRFPNVVGGRATHGVIYDLLNKLQRHPDELEVLGDGSQEKPYLHVSELIDAMVHLYEKAQERLNYHNIAPPDSTTTVRYIAAAVVRATSPDAKIRYTGGSRGWTGDVPQFRYKVDKLRASGWLPKMTSNEAVERAIRECLAAHKR